MTIPKQMLDAATKVLLDRIGSVLNFHGKAIVYTVMSGIEDVAEEALTAALGAQWRPIETAPKDETSDESMIQLGWWTREEAPEWQQCAGWWNGDEWETHGLEIAHCDITHWMPLPPPPTASDSREK